MNSAAETSRTPGISGESNAVSQPGNSDASTLCNALEDAAAALLFSKSGGEKKREPSAEGLGVGKIGSKKKGGEENRE